MDIWDPSHALRCITNAIPTNLPRAGSTCGLGLDVFEIDTLSLAVRKRTAVNSGTLVNGLAKIHAPIYARTSEWKEKLLKTSMEKGTMEAFECVAHMDHAGKIARLFR